MVYDGKENNGHFRQPIDLILLSPLFLVVSLLIKIDIKGTNLLSQIRIGKDGKEFHIYSSEQWWWILERIPAQCGQRKMIQDSLI